MIIGLLGALQIFLAFRVVHRLLRTAGGDRIEVSLESPSEQVSIILPVVNEAARIQACLESLVAQPGAIPIERPTRALGRRQPGSRRLDWQSMGPLPGV